MVAVDFTSPDGLEKGIMLRAGDRDDAGRREGARFSRERRHGTRETGAEAVANKLLDTLQHAEAKQVAAWVRQQHKVPQDQIFRLGSIFQYVLLLGESVTSGVRLEARPALRCTR